MMHLEQKYIIHRDLGARNLLVSEADGKYVIKIADFGLSREVQEDLYLATDSTFPVKVRKILGNFSGIFIDFFWCSGVLLKLFW